MSISLEHVALCCKDREGLKNWYQRKFDMKPVFMNGQESFFLKSANGGIIEFLDASTEPEPSAEDAAGLRHIAFVTDDLDSTMQRLSDAKGIRELSDAKSGTRMAFYHDPENNIVQLVSRKRPLI
jgi:glyoxylase I family protein